MSRSPAQTGPADRSPHPRRLATLGAVILATVGLAACREIPGQEAAAKPEATPSGDVAQAPQQPVGSTPGRATPVPWPELEREPEVTPPAAVVEPASPEQGRAAQDEDVLPPGADGSDRDSAPPESAEEAEMAAEDPAADEIEVLGTTAASPKEPKPIDPWRLIGQPYLVDDEAPAAAADGLTTFTLWFRTKGDFRGVRQGTSVTDDRHYKVGLIEVLDLPGYVPGGVGMIQLSERMKQKGRFCWTAEVHLKGERGEKRFPIRRAGAELQIEMDLRDAPVQRRTATVVVRNAVSDDPPVTPVERELACR